MKYDEIRIGDIVGADNVSVKPETCMVYSKDVTSLPTLAFQIISKNFDVVTQPVDVLSLQNLIWYAVDNNIPLVPRGNGTSGWGGAIPTRAGICVDLSEMNKILYFNEYESRAEYYDEWLQEQLVVWALKLKGNSQNNPIYYSQFIIHNL